MIRSRRVCGTHPVLHIVVSVLIATTGFSGTTGKIAGRITDKSTGEAVPGVNVMVRDLKIGAITNNNGDYFILKLPPGTYTVVVSMVGYEGMSLTNVGVIVDRTTTLNVPLAPTDITGEMITMVAERPVVDKNLTASEQVVTGSDDRKGRVQDGQGGTSETQTGMFADNSMLAWQRGGTRAYVRGKFDGPGGLHARQPLGQQRHGLRQLLRVQHLDHRTDIGADRRLQRRIRRRAFRRREHHLERSAGRHSTGRCSRAMRPAGVYHFGRNMYSTENNDYVSTGLNYWTAQSQDANSVYLRTGSRFAPVGMAQADHAERHAWASTPSGPEYERKGRSSGASPRTSDFMVSGALQAGRRHLSAGDPVQSRIQHPGIPQLQIFTELKVARRRIRRRVRKRGLHVDEHEHQRIRAGSRGGSRRSESTNSTRGRSSTCSVRRTGNGPSIAGGRSCTGR